MQCRACHGSRPATRAWTGSGVTHLRIPVDHAVPGHDRSRRARHPPSSNDTVGWSRSNRRGRGHAALCGAVSREFTLILPVILAWSSDAGTWLRDQSQHSHRDRSEAGAPSRLGAGQRSNTCGGGVTASLPARSTRRSRRRRGSPLFARLAGQPGPGPIDPDLPGQRGRIYVQQCHTWKYSYRGGPLLAAPRRTSISSRSRPTGRLDALRIVRPAVQIGVPPAYHVTFIPLGAFVSMFSSAQSR